MRNKKLTVLLAVTLAVFCFTAFSAMAEVKTVPVEKKHSSPVIEGMVETADGGVIFTKVAAVGDTNWIRVFNDPGTECAPGLSSDGGQGTEAPGYATWCWEGGGAPGLPSDSCSNTTVYGIGSGLPGCFDHYDVFADLTNQWHIDTFMAFTDVTDPLPDYSPWCGEFGDTLIWKNDWGYGPAYNWSLILNLGKSGAGFNAATGFTIGGIHMYDCEINYDYCYLEYALSNNETTATWLELDRFFGTSFADAGCTGTGGADYGCATFGPFEYVGPALDNSATDLLVRWRFASDNAWDDEDASGGVHTDGAWRVDNIYAKSVTPSTNYGPENFETGTFGPEWSAPSLPQAEIGGFWSGGKWVHGTPILTDWWTLDHDPGYINKGATCEYSNNWMWASDNTALGAQAYKEDAFNFRLVTPVFECGPNTPYNGTKGAWTGVFIEYDSYFCIPSVAGEVVDQQLRVYDRTIQRWGQWSGDNYVNIAGCQFWNIDRRDDWSNFLNANTDSIQFSWSILDRCDYNTAGELPCMGNHRKVVYLIDNVSVGVFSSTTTQWSLGGANVFVDTYARDLDLHSSSRENWELWPGNTWEDEDSLQIEVRDFDGVKGNTVKIHWRVSIDCGQTFDKDAARPLGSKDPLTEPWHSKALHFSVPDDPIGGPGTKNEFAGAYRTRLTIAENSAAIGGATVWPEGTVVEYFFSAEDSLNNIDTFPTRGTYGQTSMDLVTANWDRRGDWPFKVEVLPCPTSIRPLPAGQNQKVLLVANARHGTYDIVADTDGSGALTTVTVPRVRQIWEESLDRLGIVYDEYDMFGGAIARGQQTPIYAQPTDPDGYGGIIDHTTNTRRYNTVIWFFGRYSDVRTLVDSTQIELERYIDAGGANFTDGANLWVAGNDLCEDGELSDPSWVDASSNQTTNSAHFWEITAGLTPVIGGCTDDTGLKGLPGTNAYTLVGQPSTIFANMTAMVGLWDCPIIGDPDNSIVTSTATALVNFGTGGTSTFLKTHPHVVSNSNVVVSTTPLEVLGSLKARDCFTQTILTQFGTGIPNPLADCTINVDVPNGVPGRMVLHQNTPNPFNPTTKIRFSLPVKSHVELRIFDVAGREVKTLVNSQLEAGANYEYSWYGKDDNGAEVGSGVYFYRLTAGKDSQTRKMVLIR